jgi:hypothetical protein
MRRWNDSDLEQYYNRTYNEALGDGFTNEELSNLDLSLINKRTKSKRILYLIRLAFTIGRLRGIRDIDSSKTPIKLRQEDKQ